MGLDYEWSEAQHRSILRQVPVFWTEHEDVFYGFRMAHYDRFLPDGQIVPSMLYTQRQLVSSN